MCDDPFLLFKLKDVNDLNNHNEQQFITDGNNSRQGIERLFMFLSNKFKTFHAAILVLPHKTDVSKAFPKFQVISRISESIQGIFVLILMYFLW